MKRKKILKVATLFSVVTMVAVTLFASQQKKSDSPLLMENIEALANDEEQWETCYYVNVWTPDAPFLLHCSDYTLRKGYGNPTADCPKQ